MKNEKNRILNVAIVCEESQVVCKAFRELGHNAYSCDLLPCSGQHPEWHFQADCFEIIENKGGVLQNGETIYVENWDLMIAHPPCTHLAVSGMRWFKEGIKPEYLKDQASEFFMQLINAKIPHIAVENPICIMSSRYRKPDQIINPYQFWHPEQKKTCLWLKGLPKLEETGNVYNYMMTLPIKERTRIHWLGSGKAKERSVTYLGIARAMAHQWSQYLIEQI